MTYSEWYSKQTPERQKKSIELLDLSRSLGDLQRKAPFSDEAKAASLKLRKMLAELNE